MIRNDAFGDGIGNALFGDDASDLRRMPTPVSRSHHGHARIVTRDTPYDVEHEVLLTGKGKIALCDVAKFHACVGLLNSAGQLGVHTDEADNMIAARHHHVHEPMPGCMFAKWQNRVASSMLERDVPYNPHQVQRRRSVCQPINRLSPPRADFTSRRIAPIADATDPDKSQLDLWSRMKIILGNNSPQGRAAGTKPAVAVLSIAMACGIVLAPIGASAAAPSSVKSRECGLHLTLAQRREIYFDVDKLGRSVVAPTGFIVKVGGTLPKSVKLNPLPSSTIRRMPAVRPYDYAALYYFGMVTNELLLVDPNSRRVDAVIVP